MSCKDVTSDKIFPIGVIVFDEDTSAEKKQMLPLAGKKAMSTFLNSFLGLSIPDSIDVSKYAMLVVIR